MSEVKRYFLDGNDAFMRENTDGDYIDATAYDTLQSALLKAEHTIAEIYKETEAEIHSRVAEKDARIALLEAKLELAVKQRNGFVEVGYSDDKQAKIRIAELDAELSALTLKEKGE